MTRDAREIEREGMLSDMDTLRAEKRELRAEIGRLKADNHRLMMWNEELRDVLTWTEQNCPGKCAGVVGAALREPKL